MLKLDIFLGMNELLNLYGLNGRFLSFCFIPFIAHSLLFLLLFFFSFLCDVGIGDDDND